MYFILDEAVRQVTHQITSHEPERGGALLGLPGQPVITQFLYDDKAQTTSSSYQPSDELGKVVQLLERDGLELKGIIHSHPGQLDRPSSMDRVPLEDGLKVNPHLSHYLLPIITNMSATEDHELPSGDGKMSFFKGQRTRDGVELGKASVTQIPLLRDLESLAILLKSEDEPRIMIGSRDGVNQIIGVVLAQEIEVFVLINEYYPFSAPTILVSRGEEEAEYLPIRWLDIPESERLTESFKESFFDKPAPTAIDRELPPLVRQVNERTLIPLLSGLVTLLIKARRAKWAR